METDDDLKIYSEEVRDVLSDPPKAIYRWGNTIVLVFIIIVLLISWCIKYPDIIRTQIIITTQIPPEKIVARTSGKIEKILVADRVEVVQNTPLAIIENAADYVAVFQLKRILDTLKPVKEDFIFPFEQLPVLQLGDIENAYAIFEKEYIGYRLHKDLQPYQIEGAAQNYEVIQLRDQLSLLQQQKEISQSEQVLKQKDLDRYKKLYDKGIISAQEWEVKSIDFLQSEKNIRSMNAQISQMRSSINDLNRNSKTTKINETKDNISLLRNTLQAYNQLKKAISDWELVYVLRSSIAGEVSYLQIWTENQTIVTGDPVFTIIPKDATHYIGKVKAVAQNSGKLKLGQEVNIKLANFPDREFGIVKGRVQSISLTPDQEGNLLIDVSLPNKLETSYNKQLLFRQEMTGTADIVTEDLRLIERLLYQFKDVISR